MSILCTYNVIFLSNMFAHPFQIASFNEEAKRAFRFNDQVSNDYKMYAYGNDAGFATVDYSWMEKAGCTASGPDPSGSGSFSQSISD